MSEPFTLFDGAATGKFMFNVGAPAAEFLRDAARLVADAGSARLRREADQLDGRLLQYGTPCGAPDFLANLRDFLAEQYEDPSVKKESLVQTAGATTALSLLLGQLFPGGSTVFCEQLSYFLAVDILKAHGFTCRGVDSAADGLCLADLERQLKALPAADPKAPFSAVVYLVSVYQNPTGTVMSEAKSKALVALARQYNCLVFADDIYNMFHYDGVVQRRLFALDRPEDPDYGQGHVVSNGSFSKILAPGLRLGWMELPQTLRERCFSKSPTLISGGSLNTLTGGLVADLLAQGLVTRQVRAIREAQKQKMDALLEVLERALPAKCRVHHKPRGGYFLQLVLPTGLDSSQLVGQLRQKHDLLVHDGKKFLAEQRDYKDGQLNNSIRLCIAYLPLEAVKQGAELLCRELAEQVAAKNE